MTAREWNDLTPAADPIAGDSRSFGVIRDVSKSFGQPGAGKVVALDQISHDIKEGTLVSFLGPSGCGKTTLLRIVAGLTKASSGVVEIKGRPVTGPQHDFGFVFQTPNLLPWRTVMDNILFPLEINGGLDRKVRDRAEELLGLVGLSGFGASRPHQLSGGMKQRVALCRALIHSPSLLLMDEPFGALDELTRLEIQDLLHSIRQVSGATILFVTHSIAEAVYLSDEILVFSKRPGRIVDRIAVDLRYPRQPEHRYTPQFTKLEHRASAGLGVIRVT